MKKFKIPLIKPYITQKSKDEVCKVLDSGHLTEGVVTENLENEFKKYIGCRYALAVTSCTTGLEIALRSMGIGPGDEVIVPDYTYPATANAIAIVGAKIVVVDITPDTMLIDYDMIEEAITNATKAIIPVSLFGNPLDYDRLLKIKEKYNVSIVEDAACSIGAEFKEIKTGNIADVTVFSMHPRKFITTGEGGMVVTNNPNYANWMMSYKHFGMSSHVSGNQNKFIRIGSNYKMSDILAAVGITQMNSINDLLKERRDHAYYYIDLIRDNETIGLPKTTDNGKHTYQSFCVFVENRDQIMEYLLQSGIEVQIGTYSLHMQPAFQKKSYCRIHGNMENSKKVFFNTLTLPLYHDITKSEQVLVIEKIKLANKNYFK